VAMTSAPMSRRLLATIFSHRPDLEALACLIHQPSYPGHQEIPEINQRILLKKQSAEQRNIGQPRDDDAGNTLGGNADEGFPEETTEARAEYRQCQAAADLICLQADAWEGMDEAKRPPSNRSR
jgi:hypothetical protein